MACGGDDGYGCLWWCDGDDLARVCCVRRELPRPNSKQQETRDDMQNRIKKHKKKGTKEQGSDSSSLDSDSDTDPQ